MWGSETGGTRLGGPGNGDPGDDARAKGTVARIKAGERAAFGDLYSQYVDPVYGYLTLLLDDPHAAEDATQQIFVDLFEGIGHYEPRDTPFRAWLFTLVRNHAITQLRKGSRIEVEDPERVTRRVEKQDVDTGVGAEAEISDERLVFLIERLPLLQRQILILRYVLDMTIDQAAATLGRTSNEVRMQQYRAMRRLRQRLTAFREGPPARDRSGWQRRCPQAIVLRERRFALRP